MTFNLLQCATVVVFAAIWILVGEVLVHGHRRSDSRREYSSLY